MATFINNNPESGEREGSNSMGWVIGTILVVLVLLLLFGGLFNNTGTGNTGNGGTENLTPDVNTNTNTQ